MAQISGLFTLYRENSAQKKRKRKMQEKCRIKIKRTENLKSVVTSAVVKSMKGAYVQWHKSTPMYLTEAGAYPQLPTQPIFFFVRFQTYTAI